VTTPLLATILRHVDAHGPMGLDQYMTLCLQHPEHGYYTSSNPLSSRRDFVTAPELGSMFGDLLGAWFAQQVSNLDFAEFDLLELGPGSGRLTRLLVRALDKFHPGKLQQVHLLETSSHLRSAQFKQLAPLTPIHHDHLSEVQPSRPILIMANEFFDALPMRLFELHQARHHEWLIGHAEGTLGFLRNENPVGAGQIPTYAQADAVIEHSPQGHTHAQEIHRMVAEWGGVVLVVDYGRTTPPTNPSVRGFYRHEVTNIFEHPGDTDITYNVDFRMLTSAAEDSNLMTMATTKQGDFLRACGLVERLEQQTRIMPEEADKLQNEARMLAGQDGMGECFLVHAAAGVSK